MSRAGFMTGGAAVALVLLAAMAATVTARTGALEAAVKEEGGKPVDEAVVTLTAIGGALPVPRVTPAIMDQFDKEFIPNVLPIHVGTSVTFPNRDNIRHHVYSFSAPKKFELPLYIGTPAAPLVFDKPGVVVLGCNIHDWMVAYIYVLTTPFFAKTDKDGKARIADVPPGAYEARVWHPRMRVPTEKMTKPLTLSAAEPGQVAFVVSLKREWRAPRGPGKYEGIQGGG